MLRMLVVVPGGGGHGSWGDWEWWGLLRQISDSRILCYILCLEGLPSNLNFSQLCDSVSQ